MYLLLLVLMLMLFMLVLLPMLLLMSLVLLLWAADGADAPLAVQGEYIKTVQQRGAAIIAARKLSSAMSAAKAISDHCHDWIVGSSGKVQSRTSPTALSTSRPCKPPLPRTESAADDEQLATLDSLCPPFPVCLCVVGRDELPVCRRICRRSCRWPCLRMGATGSKRD